jgi:hypothetical protein
VAKKCVFHPDTRIGGVTDAFDIMMVMALAVVRQQRSNSREMGMFMEKIQHYLANACHHDTSWRGNYMYFNPRTEGSAREKLRQYVSPHTSAQNSHGDIHEIISTGCQNCKNLQCFKMLSILVTKCILV